MLHNKNVPFSSAHMRSMRQMNNMMNSLFADPFGMMGGFGMGGPPALTMGSRHSMVPFGFPPMPQLNMNRLLSGMRIVLKFFSYKYVLFKISFFFKCFY